MGLPPSKLPKYRDLSRCHPCLGGARRSRSYQSTAIDRVPATAQVGLGALRAVHGGAVVEVDAVEALGGSETHVVEARGGILAEATSGRGDQLSLGITRMASCLPYG